ncbi:MAG: ribonuclease III [Rhodospirillales bacterium]|nr:ribonuclease III [Rhodospirillales bacterium]
MEAVEDTGQPAESLEEALGYRFASTALLALALRHPSAGAKAGSNQRLEFLGDRVLGMVVAAMLYEAFPREAEGALSQRYSSLVRRETLAGVARSLALGDRLTLGRSEGAAGGRDNPANLADACEAVIGALYIDGGLEAAERFIRRHWTPAMNADPEPPRDPKTRLQEWTQSRALGLPVYRTLSSSGPAHSPLFEVEAEVTGLGKAVATGATKRAAEQGAAGALLARINDPGRNGDG